MGRIYITGHRNPDLDSICSAYAYAVLKNRIDPDNEYVGIRCGHLSQTLKNQLAAVEITPVPYMRDVHPKVGDVMMEGAVSFDADEPVYSLVKKYDSSRPSAAPVFSAGKFAGLLSVDDITAWFLKDNSDKVPVYRFVIDNIEKVLPGRFLKVGCREFQGSIIVGAAALDEFSKIVADSPDSVVVMGYRKDHIRKAMELNVPAIVVTTMGQSSDIDGEIDFSEYKGSIFITELGTSETIRRLRMAIPLKDIMGKQGKTLQITELFDDAKTALIESGLRGLSVFDGEEWVGFVTRRCFLSKPEYGVILVDHNEAGQSIRGIETANVKEIIDHHRLDSLKTSVPIFIDSEPLGSTCTIVYQQFVRNSIVPDELTARVLLTGIISDTLILKSPTTSRTDRSSAGALAALCGILDIQKFGEKLFSFAESLASSDPKIEIASDFKTYKEKGFAFGVGQCEVTTLKDLDVYSSIYLEALEKFRVASSLDWAALMITDVLREKSVLLVTDNPVNRKLPYSLISERIFDMPGILSRKKQLLPEILHCYET